MHTTNPQSNTRPDSSVIRLQQVMTRQVISSRVIAALPEKLQEQA
jgi:hypothetical protein